MKISPEQIQEMIRIQNKHGLALDEKEAKERLETLAKIFQWLIKNDRTNKKGEPSSREQSL